MASSSSHSSLLHPSYLQCTANTWSDIKSDPGDKELKIGYVQLEIKKDPTPFVGGVGSPPPREVKASMALLLKLPLLHGTQAADATDTAMHLIATSEHARLASLGNACTKPNQRLACDFLNFLAFNLAFNEFAVRERIASEDKRWCRPLTMLMISLPTITKYWEIICAKLMKLGF